MNDPELDELFSDPADREVVDLLKASRPAAPPLDPHFRNYLRAKLMTEARRTLPARTSRPWFPFTLSPRTLAPAMAAVAAGFLVVLGVEIYLHHQPASIPVAVNIGKTIDKKTDVGTAEPIVIPFSGPVDKTAVAESVQIQPATSVTKQWVGQNLVIIPDHPLAPNTSYTVSLKPSATSPPQPNPTAASQPKPTAQPAPTVAPTPVVVHFTTARPPVLPVVPPSFKSSNVSYGFDSRLGDFTTSGSVLSAAWTPAGRLLVTRPAGQPGPGSLASPSASTTPSAAPAPKATTDVWLMSSLGTPIRILVPGGSFPAAAPSNRLLAAWRVVPGNQATLEVWDLQGTPPATIATLDGAPDRAPVWIGADRIAYVDQGRLRVVDLHGSQTDGSRIKMGRGSLAASPTSPLLAVEGASGSVVLDLGATATGPTTLLPQGATGFAWSLKGDLGFLVQQNGGTDLYVAADGKTSTKVATSANGQTWSDLSWGPDATSLLLATRATNGTGAPGLILVNGDGSSPTSFGAPSREYASPQWSPSGDLVLFTRRDEVGGRAFWTATATPSTTDAAENQALAEVDRFMQARIHGDSVGAQAELDDAGLAAYRAGSSLLLNPAGNPFSRYYPVTVQLTGSTPNQFLVGVRIFSARGGVETSFFEEQLTLVLQGQRYLVHAVTASATLALGHGPTVVSVEVVQSPPGEQVRVHFDADLKSETVSRETIQVKDGDGKVVDARVTFDPDNHLATLAVKLRPGNYQLVVTTGVTDVNGVMLAQEYDAPLVIGG